MKLFSYWRSTTSFRVRVVLNLKGFDYEIVPVNLVKGEQKSTAYTMLNPAKVVPTLVLDDGRHLTQSMAIIDYLDAVQPDPAILPSEPFARAKVQAACNVIALDIHPVNNLRVLAYLKGELGHSQDEAVVWMNHWMHEGFNAFQSLIRTDRPYCFSDEPGLADICLAGQMINARRWGLDMTPFKRLHDIDARTRDIPAFHAALPEQQPDAD